MKFSAQSLLEIPIGVCLRHYFSFEGKRENGEKAENWGEDRFLSVYSSLALQLYVTPKLFQPRPHSQVNGGIGHGGNDSDPGWEWAIKRSSPTQQKQHQHIYWNTIWLDRASDDLRASHLTPLPFREFSAS